MFSRKMELSNTELQNDISRLLGSSEPVTALVSFVRDKLKENSQEWRRILNSGRKMYELGRKDEVSGLSNALPPFREGEPEDQYGKGFNEGFNDCLYILKEILRRRGDHTTSI